MVEILTKAIESIPEILSSTWSFLSSFFLSLIQYEWGIVFLLSMFGGLILRMGFAFFKWLFSGINKI